MNNGPSSESAIYRLSDFLQEKFRKKVYRVTVDGGFTCPNRTGNGGGRPCAFCDERGSGARHNSPEDAIAIQYRKGKQRIRERYHANLFIPYFQSYTNTYAPAETCLERYGQVLDDEAVGIAIGTRPDCLEEPLLDALATIAENRLVILDLGVQSMTDRVLRKIHRGHDAGATMDALRRLRCRPEIHVCVHLIFGLPTETDVEMMSSLKLFQTPGVHGLKIHQLNILKGTEMAAWYDAGQVRPMALDRYVGLVTDFIERVPRHVVIHRLSARADDHASLLAPEWGSARLMPMQRVLDQLKCRGSHQGKLFGQEWHAGGNSRCETNSE